MTCARFSRRTIGRCRLHIAARTRSGACVFSGIGRCAAVEAPLGKARCQARSATKRSNDDTFLAQAHLEVSGADKDEYIRYINATMENKPGATLDFDGETTPLKRKEAMDSELAALATHEPVSKRKRVPRPADSEN